VNLSIEQGDRIGIIGRNGAGKSTLLKVISRIVEPTSGSIKIKGRVASLLEVGTGFHPELTGRENIFLNGAILGMKREEIKKHFDAIVDFADVETFLDTPVKRYSSGMYVRLAFAVAAHLEPEILIVDEVLAVGDVQFQKKCLGKMEDISKSEGRTVLFVSHNMGLISQLCKKAVVLNQGSVGYLGDTSSSVEYYLNQQQQQISYVAADVNKDYVILNTEAINDSGSPSTHFLTSEKIALKIKIKKNISNPHVRFSCTIQSKTGDFLSTFIEELGNYFNNETGEKELLIEFPAHLLAPNNYAFRVVIFVGNGKVLDMAEMICPITIIDEGSSMALFEGTNYGYFIPHHSIKEINQ
jgi:lipopolysaccharide transport system ATP-binding protein